MYAPRVQKDPTTLFTAPDQARIASQVAAEHGTLNAETLAQWAANHRGGADSSVLENMFSVLQTGAAPAPQRGELGARTKNSRLAEKTEAIETEFKSAFGQFVIGQKHAVGRLAQKMAARRLRESDDPTPMNMALPGPPGVGKTESIKAMAHAIHGDANMFIEINCSTFQKPEDLAKLIGAPPGYVGSGQTADSSPMSMKNIQAKFGDKRPILILWDEVDKIGGGNTKVQEDFFKILGNFMQSGKFQFNDNCPNTEVPDVINFFTSNSGMESAAGLKGKSLREHYIKSMRTVLPQHIQSRIASNFIGFDPLTTTDRMDIARLKIGKKLRAAEKRTADDRGFSINLDVNDDVLRLFAEITGSDLFGARPLEDLIRDYVEPLIPDVRRRAQAGEVWHLVMKKTDVDSEGNEREISRVEINKLKRAFLDSLETGSAPEGVDFSTFPIEFKCLNPKRRLFPYDGVVPRTPGAEMLPLGAGAIGGQRFFFTNQGGIGDDNQLYIVKPGLTEIEDRFDAVKIPDELANANTYARGAQIDDDHAIFYAVNAPEKGDEAEITTFLATAKGRSIDFEKVPSPGSAVDWPELALVGPALVGAEGKALLWGGRRMEKLSDGDWSVSPDPARMIGEPIENGAYLFDVKAKTWTHIEDAPATGRIGAAVTVHDGKAFLIGGEEIKRDDHQRVDTSQSSTAVDIFDFDTQTFTRGTPLPNAVQWASAFAEPSGQVSVVGGLQLSEGGRVPNFTKVMRMLGANGEWLEEPIEKLGVNVAIIPHVDGDQIVGPFGEDGEFLIRRPAREDEEL